LFGLVVMMVKLRILSPAGERQVSHNPAHQSCRSPIETSPASPIEMSRSLVCLRLVEVGISEITVKVHRGQVMRKMKATSLPDLARMVDKLDFAAEKSQSC
jgi:hypothetical protein